ncbi:hypothetical protein [uncultured Corynebacterium sp.]|uniref:hypothetical protein n=1 Tax=uncultured Corynebacterium sp. TaxID=159447 RepID=UPI00288C63E4|nr:hypothetical protein [uncultured Corynebacterium sp.]HCD4228847.1 hypothetical protein [Corynebacterium striatum]
MRETTLQKYARTGLFGHEAAKIRRQILDQAEPFNAAHTTNWGLPFKPTVTRG